MYKIQILICILISIYIYIYILRLYICNMYISFGTSPTSLREKRTESEFTTIKLTRRSAQGAKVSAHCALFNNCQLLLLSDKSGKQTCTLSTYLMARERGGHVIRFSLYFSYSIYDIKDLGPKWLIGKIEGYWIWG